MSEPRVPQAALGLGDTNVDTDILTKEIDHDFFDDPVGSSAGGAAYMGGFAAATCQDKGEGDKEVKILNNMPKEEDNGLRGATWKPDGGKSSNGDEDFLRLVDKKDETGPEDYYRHHYKKLDEDSGRSSASITVHLEVEKERGKGDLGASGGAAATATEDFYSMQSNANYPRPKESYKLQQRRRSFGSIQPPQTQKNSYNPSAYAKANQQEQFEPMNPSDCGLNAHFGDVTSSSDSSSNSGGAAADADDDESDSDLSDSSESELESLNSDDEEFVDMLEKYFDYVDPDSDCSDLTEVSPLSSLAASPLPPSFFGGVGIGGGDGADQGMQPAYHMNIATDAELCAATEGLQIGGGNGVAEEYNEGGQPEGAGCSMGLSATAMAAVTAVASAVPAAAQLIERDLLRSAGKAKPRLPMVISTMETVIIPAGRGGANEDESDEDNNAPRSTISGGATCGTSIDNDDTEGEEIYYEPSSELHEMGEFGEPDPAKDKKELDVCFNCCVMEHAKKILSREASPSRKHKGWLLEQIKQDVAGSSGNPGGNGNPRDKDKGRGPSTWNGKLRAGSSTSATSSSSSTTTTGSSSSTSNSQKGAAGGSMKKAQRNFTFTPEQMRKIERENHVLLRKILDTHQKRYHHGNHCHHHRCKNNGHHQHQHHQHQSRTMTTSSTSITRLRQQKRIEHENTVLMKKLQNVKPSKEIGDAFGKAGK